MKFTIDRIAFTRGLKLAASTAEAKSPQPMLACVHLAATKDKVKLSATDLTVGVTSTIAATVATVGSLAVDARAILDRVGAMTGVEITATRDGNSIELAAGRARFRVPCLDGRDFPKVLETDAPHDACDAGELVAAFAAAMPAVCTDATRFHLGGVFVDGASFVATDGHRLIVRKIRKTIGGRRIVPAKGVAQIIKTIGDAESCEVAWSDAAVFVRASDVAVAVKLIDAQFPPWEQAVPTSGRAVTVSRTALAGVIDRARKVAGDSDAVVLSFATDSQEIAVSAHHADRGEYTDAIEIIDDAWSGAPLAMHFNGRYVADVLAVASTETCELLMPPDDKNAQLMPFVVVLGDTRGTIMPMRPK